MSTAFDLNVRVSILARNFGRAWSVSKFGDPNARVFGTIIGVVGRSKYLVRWDDGDELEHNRQALRVELNAPPPPTDDPSDSESSEIRSDAQSSGSDTSESGDEQLVPHPETRRRASEGYRP